MNTPLVGWSTRCPLMLYHGPSVSLPEASVSKMIEASPLLNVSRLGAEAKDNRLR